MVRTMRNGPTGKWSTTDDITNPLTRRALGLDSERKDQTE